MVSHRRHRRVHDGHRGFASDRMRGADPTPLGADSSYASTADRRGSAFSAFPKCRQYVPLGSANRRSYAVPDTVQPGACADEHPVHAGAGYIHDGGATGRGTGSTFLRWTGSSDGTCRASQRQRARRRSGTDHLWWPRYRRGSIRTLPSMASPSNPGSLP